MEVVVSLAPLFIVVVADPTLMAPGAGGGAGGPGGAAADTYVPDAPLGEPLIDSDVVKLPDTATTRSELELTCSSTIAVCELEPPVMESPAANVPLLVVTENEVG